MLSKFAGFIQSAILLKVTFLYSCFSAFFNYATGTKRHNISPVCEYVFFRNFRFVDLAYLKTTDFNSPLFFGMQ